MLVLRLTICGSASLGHDTVDEHILARHYLGHVSQDVLVTKQENKTYHFRHLEKLQS